MNRYTSQTRSAGEVSWPTTGEGIGLVYDPETGVYRDPNTTSIVQTPPTNALPGTQGYDHTAQDWSRVGTALIVGGTATAIGIFRGLNAADQARALQDNAAAMARLRESFGFSNNPAAQSEYAQRAELQRLASQKNTMTIVYVGGAALLLLGLVYAVTRSRS